MSFPADVGFARGIAVIGPMPTAPNRPTTNAFDAQLDPTNTGLAQWLAEATGDLWVLTEGPDAEQAAQAVVTARDSLTAAACAYRVDVVVVTIPQAASRWRAFTERTQQITNQPNVPALIASANAWEALRCAYDSPLAHGARSGEEYLAATAVAQRDPERYRYRPDVLLFALDDASVDIAPMGGNADTPNISALIDRGTLFPNATVDSVGCNPSRISFFTSLLGASTGVTSQLGTDQDNFRAVIAAEGKGVGPDVKTIWKLARDNGYQTLGVGKLMHLVGQEVGTTSDRDYTGAAFDRYARDLDWHERDRITNIPIGAPIDFFNDARVGPLHDWGPIEAARTSDGTPVIHSDDRHLGLWRDQLAAVDANRPLFATIGLVATHIPRYVPRRLIEKYATVEPPPYDPTDPDDLGTIGHGLAGGANLYAAQLQWVIKDPEAYAYMYRCLLAAHEFLDEKIGEAIAEFNAQRDARHTVTVVWSDHGQHAGQKSRLEKGAMWAESIRIPAIVAIDGQPPSVNDVFINSVDLSMTILDVCGATADDYRRDGESLFGLIGSSDGAARTTTCWYDRYGALIDEEWWYITYDTTNMAKEEELYPTDDSGWGEQRANLARRPEFRPILQQRRAKLQQVLDRRP